jgi:Domain of unknown function (DUF1918)
MVPKIGDWIIVESEKVDVPPRRGEILEIVEHEVHTEFRVRWEDGRESGIRPPVGSYRIETSGKVTA